MREKFESRDTVSMAQTRKPTKHTFLHLTIQEYNEANHHFLVPRISEQADNDAVRVSAFDLRKEEVPRPSRPGVQGVHPSNQRLTSTFHLPDYSTRSHGTVDRESAASSRTASDLAPLCISVGFSAAMKPSGYAESVSVTDAPPTEDLSVATFCDLEEEPRFKSSVDIAPGLSPVWFQSKIVCHETTSKKNFKSVVDYVPKMKPVKFEETNYVRPKHLETTYVSYYDYNANDNQKWFTTAVHFVPSTNSSNTVHNFQMRPHTAFDGRDITTHVTVVNGSVGDDDSGESEPEGDINMNIINKSVTVQTRQPPMLMSSGPEDDDELKFGSTRLSHRTKMVVDTAPTQHGMNSDDYVVYLQGYASTGEVISHGYDKKPDVANGYLSDDTTEV